MPNYKYKCLECGHTFEAMLPAGTNETECLECGRYCAQKLLEAPEVHFKGKGFTKKKGGKCKDDECKNCPHKK